MMLLYYYDLLLFCVQIITWCFIYSPFRRISYGPLLDDHTSYGNFTNPMYDPWVRWNRRPEPEMVKSSACRGDRLCVSRWRLVQSLNQQISEIGSLGATDTVGFFPVALQKLLWNFKRFHFWNLQWRCVRALSALLKQRLLLAWSFLFVCLFV